MMKNFVMTRGLVMAGSDDGKSNGLQIIVLVP